MSEKVQVVPLAQVSNDARRTIVEAMVGFEADKASVQRVTMITANAEAVLGNHHHDGVETFLFAAGVARLYTQPVKNSKAEGPMEEIFLQQPSLIVIPRGVAHTFVFLQPGMLVALTNTTHEDLGTHAWKLA